MQKTVKAPKTHEAGSAKGQLQKEIHHRLQQISPDDFKVELIKAVNHHRGIAQNAQKTPVMEALAMNLAGLEYCFEKVHLDGDQLVSVSQSTLASIEKAHEELETDSQVASDPENAKELEKLAFVTEALHEWVSEYQSQLVFIKKNATPTSHGSHKHHHTGHHQPGPLPPNYNLSALINALNVSTIPAMETAVQNLNQFFQDYPAAPVSLTQFYHLFDLLDQTFQKLPGTLGTGNSQLQAIVGLSVLNRQVNQLYGYLMSRQIV